MVIVCHCTAVVTKNDHIPSRREVEASRKSSQVEVESSQVTSVRAGQQVIQECVVWTQQSTISHSTVDTDAAILSLLMLSNFPHHHHLLLLVGVTLLYGMRLLYCLSQEWQ